MEDNKICVTYRRQTYNKWVSLWDEWKPLDLWMRPWRYYRGNIAMGGFWNGLSANITLTSPLINKLWHWKYRNMHLNGGLFAAAYSIPHIVANAPKSA